MPKQWKMQTPRLRCPHCGGTIFCTTNARWHIHGVGAPIERATPQKPSLYSPAPDDDTPEPDEGEERGDG